MDLGYQGGDLLWMAEHGIFTLSYQSTSYLADRVPELEFADLPFLFDDLAHARTVMDGKLGEFSAGQSRSAFPVIACSAISRTATAIFRTACIRFARSRISGACAQG